MNKGVKSVLVCLIFLSALVSSVIQTSAWSNGGYSDDPSNPDYGTHDWIAEQALNWLPASEKEYIINNLTAYLYGTELPDNPYPEDGIGDTANHHVYYDSTLTLIDDSAAVRAQEEYDLALSYLNASDPAKAAKTVGVLSHYIVDLAVFGHVMGATTDWGAEDHHSDYESYVNTRTNSYIDDFNIYLSFDGELNNVSAYDAALLLAYDTTFDVDGDLSCVWMDSNYDWSNQTFRDRCGESLNLAVNQLTDVLHTLYVESGEEEQSNPTADLMVNEVELNPSGNDNYLSVEEWVELYNPTTDEVDLSGWKISTTQGTTVTITITQGTIIPAKGYYVYGRGSQWLDNNDESIVLQDSNGAEVDRTPVVSDNENDYRSWQRYPNGQDSWSFRSSTKESSNGGEAPPDETPPSISNVMHEPTNPKPGEQVNVTVTITDESSGVDNATLYYRVDSGTWISKSMSGTGDLWNASIPGQLDGVNVDYYLQAFDKAGNKKETSTYNYAVSNAIPLGGTVLRNETILFSEHFSVQAGYYYRFFMANINETCLRIRINSSEGITVYVQTLGEFTMSANTHFGVIFSTWSFGSFFDSTEIDEVTILPYEETWCFTIINYHDNDVEIDAIISTGTHILTAISCAVSQSNITIGDAVTVSGSISPTVSWTTVNLSVKRDEGLWIDLVTVATDSEGAYSYSWNPEAVGLYDVKASWDGYGFYEGSESDTASLQVNKISTSISCAVSQSNLNIGDSVSVFGSISPPISDVTVTLTYTKPNGTMFTRTCTTNQGDYGDTYAPDVLESWSVKASWEGDSTCAGAMSSSTSFIVSKISTSISCSLSSSSLAIGDFVTVSGSITPARSDVDITISYKINGSWIALATVTSAADGSYSYSWTPGSEGYYQVKASWEGDDTYSVATSSTVTVSVTAPKTSTTISCHIPYTEIPLGSTLTVSGMILPTPSLSDGEVTLTYTQPDGTVQNRTVPIGSDGGYDDMFSPGIVGGIVGEWSVTASWSGDASLEGAISATQTFTVTLPATTGIPLEIIALVLICSGVTITLVLYKRTNLL